MLSSLIASTMLLTVVTFVDGYLSHACIYAFFICSYNFNTKISYVAIVSGILVLKTKQ